MVVRVLRWAVEGAGKGEACLLPPDWREIRRGDSGWEDGEQVPMLMVLVVELGAGDVLPSMALYLSKAQYTVCTAGLPCAQPSPASRHRETKPREESRRTLGLPWTLPSRLAGRVTSVFTTPVVSTSDRWADTT